MKFKNQIKWLTAFVLILSLSVTALSFSSYAEEGNEPTLPPQTDLVLPETVREGETFDLTLCLDTALIHVANGVITYDNEKLTFVSAQSLVDDWIVTTSVSDGEVTFLAIDILLEHPVEGALSLVSFTFSQNEGVSQGDGFSFTCGDISVSNGSEDFTLAGSEESITLSRPLSSLASLSGLTVGADLTPAFDSAVNEYSVVVPYGTESLDIAYECDEFARVEIIGNELSVGLNTVTVRVWSEDGSASTDYQLSVTRAPSEQSGGDCDSSVQQITLSSGHITPAFKPDVFEYTLYVTKDVTSLTVSAVPTSSTSTVSELELDLTSVEPQKLVCRASDGSVSEYSFTVRYIEDENQMQGDGQASDNKDDPAELVGALLSKLGSWGTGVIIAVAVIIAVTAFFIGFIIAFAIKGKKKKKGAAGTAPIPVAAAAAPENAPESAQSQEAAQPEGEENQTKE